MNPFASLPNPFRGSIIATPWEERMIDVNSIHGDVFQICCDAVEFVRERGTSAGVLIQGRPGSGKTHLLGRLRRKLTSWQDRTDLAEPAQAFVWIRLNTNPRWLWRHVRQHFIDDLLKKMPDGLTQLEHLLALRIATVANGAGDLAHWWEYMRDERTSALEDYLDEIAGEANITHALMTVLEHWVRRYHRRECRSWLRGESLPDSVLTKLNLSPEQGEADHEALEQQAREVVLSLCRLAGSRMPIVFCFDQIEALQVSLDDTGGLRELGNLIRDLHDETRNSVLISCVQTEYFDLVRQRLPAFALHALEGFSSQSLNPLLTEEASQLVTARFQEVPEFDALPTAARNQLHTLMMEDVQGFVGTTGCSPRELINFCGDRFLVHQGKTPNSAIQLDQALQTLWDTRWEEASRNNESSQTEHILADGLPLLLDVTAEGWTVHESEDEQDLEFILEGPGSEARVGVKFCTQQNMTSFSSHLRRLISRLQQNDLQKLVMIRDQRTPISSNAKRARQYLDDLTADSTRVLLRTNLETMAALDALRVILSDAQAGDLAVQGKSVSVQTLRDWLRQHLAAPLAELSEQLTGYPSLVESWSEENEGLNDRLAELLAEHRVISLAAAAEKLNCGQEMLARAAADRCGIIEGRTPVLFETMTR